jgi:hypothetical protein
MYPLQSRGHDLPKPPNRFPKGGKARCLSANFAFREINPVSSSGFAWVDKDPKRKGAFSKPLKIAFE